MLRLGRNTFLVLLGAINFACTNIREDLINSGILTPTPAEADIGASTGGSLIGNIPGGSIIGNHDNGALIGNLPGGSTIGVHADGALVGNIPGGSTIGAIPGGATIGTVSGGSVIGIGRGGAMVGSSRNGTTVGTSAGGNLIGNSPRSAAIGSPFNGALIGDGRGARIGTGPSSATVGTRFHGATIGSNSKYAALGTARGQNSVGNERNATTIGEQASGSNVRGSNLPRSDARSPSSETNRVDRLPQSLSAGSAAGERVPPPGWISRIFDFLPRASAKTNTLENPATEPSSSTKTVSQNQQNPNKGLSITQSGTYQPKQAVTNANSGASSKSPFPANQLNYVRTTQWPVAPAARNALVALAVKGQIATGNAVAINGFIYPASMQNASRLQQEQCVSLVKALSNVGATTTWVNRGTATTINAYANGKHPDIPPGTPIATFSANGRYPDKGEMGTPRLDGNREALTLAHAAIFLSYAYDQTGKPIGMNILHQSENHRAAVDTKYFITNTPIDNTRPTMGYAYSVISSR